MDNGNISREVGPEPEFTQLAISYQQDPQDYVLEVLITKFFTPIAKHWAWEISISREDQEEAMNTILMHMVEGVRPKWMRRISSVSRIRKQRAAGYDRHDMPAQAAFWDLAEKKAFDILKARRRAWKKRSELMGEVIQSESLYTAPIEITE